MTSKDNKHMMDFLMQVNLTRGEDTMMITEWSNS